MTREKSPPARAQPRHHSHRAFPHVPTPPPGNLATSTCATPRGASPGQAPKPPGKGAPDPPTRTGLLLLLLLLLLFIPSPLQTQSRPEPRWERGGTRRDTNFFTIFFLVAEGSSASPRRRACGGGGEPRRRLTAGRGRGLRGWRGRGMEERAWERGSRSCGRASPHPKLPHKAAAALGSHPILCVFHQGLMGRGCPCFPEPAAPPPRGGGQGPLPGMAATTGVPGWAQTRGGCGSPRISPPLTRVAPGYQQH